MFAHSGTLRFTAVLCSVLVSSGDLPLIGQQSPPAATTTGATPKIPADQLDSLVAPIALYPDPMLAQALAASTYPLEIIQLQQWLEKNKNLKDKALADAVAKQPWDASVQAMAGLPDVVRRLADDIKWTTELGNAFLAQQSDVMDAVQRMRAKAKDKGNLKSNEQMKVETTVVESKQVVVIQQANPQVVYVPTYNPTVVYGPPPYPYPPAPSWGYAAAGMAISFGVGVAMGAMWSGGWGYNCGWGGNNNVYINNNNNFNRNTNVNRNANINGSGNRANQWQHNPQHRGGAPYGDRSTADRFGGTARGDSLSSRQANARQSQGTQGDRNLGANRGSDGDRNLGANRGSDGDRNLGANRGSDNDRNLGADGDRNAGANRGSDNDRNMGANRGSAGSDRIGNRQVSSSDGSRGGGAFSGADRSSGSSARASSSRGSSSFGGSRGGGGFRGGGGGRRR